MTKNTSPMKAQRRDACLHRNLTRVTMARGSRCLCRTSSRRGWVEGSKLLPGDFVGAMLLQLDGTHLEPEGPFKSADLGGRPTAGQGRGCRVAHGGEGTPSRFLFDFCGQRHADPRVLHSVWVSPSGTPRDAEVSGGGAEGQWHRTFPAQHCIPWPVPMGTVGTDPGSSSPLAGVCFLPGESTRTNNMETNQTPTSGTRRNRNPHTSLAGWAVVQPLRRRPGGCSERCTQSDCAVSNATPSCVPKRNICPQTST